MEAKREKALVKQYSLQLKEEKARQKEVRRQAVSDAGLSDHCVVNALHLTCFCVFACFNRKRGKEEKRT